MKAETCNNLVKNSHRGIGASTMRILDGFITSSDIIPYLCASSVRVVGCVAGSAGGCGDPMQDHQENDLGEFKVQSPWGTSFATSLSIYWIFHGLLASSELPYLV